MNLLLLKPDYHAIYTYRQERGGWFRSAAPPRIRIEATSAVRVLAFDVPGGELFNKSGKTTQAFLDLRGRVIEATVLLPRDFAGPWCLLLLNPTKDKYIAAQHSVY